MIDIIEYQPRWRDEFNEVAGRLRQVLGDKALRIDHVGSTSVPGLAAKNVIDIQVTVRELGPSLIPLLGSLDLRIPSGFEHLPYHEDHQPPGYPSAVGEWHKLFFWRLEPYRVNVHVRVQGKANQRFALLFRDYLRSSPASAAAYAELKRQLAKHVTDGDIYNDIKDPAVDLIIIAAEAWALQTKWALAASDA